MNYSLFIMVMKEMMSMEEKGQPRAATAASPLQSSQFADLYCVFSVSLSPHPKIAQGSYAQMILGQDDSIEVKKLEKIP
jgi:hypothetical protein